MLKKILASVGAALALVGLSSCLEMESIISVKKDGSGTLTEKVSMGAQMVGMMKMGAAQGEEDPFAQFNEEALKNKEVRFGEGVEFESVKKEERDGGMVFTVVYKFADISTLKYEPGAIMNDDEAEAEEDTPELKFGFEGGVLTIMVPEPDASNFALGGDEMSEEQMLMMAPMMAGLKVSAKLLFEDGIESSDATYTDGNTVTLMSMDFDELMKNEGGLEVMKKLQVEGREEFAKAVKEIKGVEMEHKAKATVKLK